MTKTEIRYRIDTLIRCAKITMNEILREEWVVEAVNLLDVLQEAEIISNPIKVWIEKNCIITDGKKNGRMDRTKVYNFYNSCVTKNGEFPYMSRNAFYNELRELNVPMGKSNGIEWCGIVRKEKDYEV